MKQKKNQRKEEILDYTQRATFGGQDRKFYHRDKFCMAQNFEDFTTEDYEHYFDRYHSNY